MFQYFKWLFLILLLAGLPGAGTAVAQSPDLLAEMYRKHGSFLHPGISERRFQPEAVYAALDSLRRNPAFRIAEAGRSVAGRPIPVVSWGRGPIRILLWSQMHGDEPTATMALLDLFQALADERSFPQARQWKEKCTIHVFPLLNPDGCAAFTRVNALGVDLNRDAQRRASPEARLLWHWRDSLQPQWGFNLHDQHRYYSAGGSDLTAALSFLAPPPDERRSTPPQRAEAMKLIAHLNKGLQKMIPGQVARYYDTYEGRAFGDRFTAAGTATVLIEAGWITGDDEKQTLRRLYFATLAGALDAIAGQHHRGETEQAYQRIPFNQNRLFELLIRQATVIHSGKEYVLDIGFRREEHPTPDGLAWYARQPVAEIGDLQPFGAHHVLDARGLRVEPALSYGHVLPDPALLRDTPVQQLIRQGYAVFRIQGTGTADRYATLPLALRPPDTIASEPLFPGMEPVFYLVDPHGNRRYLVVNGTVWNLQDKKWEETLVRFLARGEE